MTTSGRASSRIHGFKLDFTIDFPHPVFGTENRHVVIDFAEHSYTKEVSRARTFGFMADIEAMRAAGLGLGGSLQNAIVLDETRVLNSEGLRYDNEFVKHKVLDAIGDIYLLGHPLIGIYAAFKSGHALNNALCARAARPTPGLGVGDLRRARRGAERLSRLATAAGLICAAARVRHTAGPTEPAATVASIRRAKMQSLVLVRLLLFLCLGRHRHRRGTVSAQAGPSLPALHRPGRAIHGRCSYSGCCCSTPSPRLCAAVETGFAGMIGQPPQGGGKLRVGKRPSAPRNVAADSLSNCFAMFYETQSPRGPGLHADLYSSKFQPRALQSVDQDRNALPNQTGGGAARQQPGQDRASRASTSPTWAARAGGRAVPNAL